MFTNFYTIEAITKQEGEYTCSIRLHPDHEIYKGHFPGMPVVPGVCMLHMLKGCLSEVLDDSLRFKTITSCKFLSVVNPQEQRLLTFVFSLKEVSGLQAVASIGGTMVLKLKATMVAE